MPLYCYKCTGCEKEFEVRHSMSFEDQDCIFCSSKKVFRIPSLLEKATKVDKKTVGKVVDQYISDAKKEIKKEKKDLLSRNL